MDEIYLDNASTTKPTQKVIDCLKIYTEKNWYNPSSLYNKGKDAKRDIENSRIIVSSSINAYNDEIYFTSGASESNCWAIQGFINDCRCKCLKPMIITSTIEHHSIIECVDNTAEDFCYIGVNCGGCIDIAQLENALKNNYTEKQILVSIQFANNEIGTIQDIKTISSLVHKYNSILHTDATQAYGHIEIDVEDLGIDLMSVSGHKINAPKGIGFLYKRRGINIKPLIYGTQEYGLRGGTENVPYIVAFSVAVKDIMENLSETKNKITILRDWSISRVLSEFNGKINGSSVNRLPNNINITLEDNISAESLIYMLDMCNIYISSGSACNSYSDKPSHVLKAIGLSDNQAKRTLRITLSEDTTKDDIDTFIKELKLQINIVSIQ